MIAGFLDLETVKLDALVAKMGGGSVGRLNIEDGSLFAKLAEYRAALISAAVTGKIDVRGEVA